MIALGRTDQKCSHNVSQKVKRIRRLSDFPEGPDSAWEIQKTEDKGLVLRYPLNGFNPHLSSEPPKRVPENWCCAIIVEK